LPEKSAKAIFLFEFVNNSKSGALLPFASFLMVSFSITLAAIFCCSG